MIRPTIRISWSTSWGPRPVSPLDSSPDRSAPAEKFPSAPVSTSARTEGSSSTWVRMASSSFHITALIAFFRCGRLRVTVTRPSSCSTIVVERSAMSIKAGGSWRSRSSRAGCGRGAGEVWGDLPVTVRVARIRF